VTLPLSRRRFLQLGGIAGAATFADLAIPEAVRAATALELPVGQIFSRPADAVKVVDVAYRPDEQGYWILTSVGQVFGIDAPDHGSAPALSAGVTIVAMAPTPDAGGYWLFSSLGTVFTFGNATNFGDLGTVALAGPVVDAVALADGSGYYMLGSDGGIFSFGNATFHGSVPQVLPGVTLNEPVVGLVPDGTTGYWLVAGDGGLFSFGSASFEGSVPQVLGTTPLAEPVIGALASGNAYLMLAADGGIFSFGTTEFLGSRPGLGIPDLPPVTCADVTANRDGYLMLDEAGGPSGFGSAEHVPNSNNSSGPVARETHTFLARWFDDSPYRWASGDPIHFVINNSLGPSGAIDQILQAIDDIAAATGLTFIYDGETTEFVDHELVDGHIFSESRDAYQPLRYGERWAPVWIGARNGFAGDSSIGTAIALTHDDFRSTENRTVEIDGVTTEVFIGEPTFISGIVAFHWGAQSPVLFDEIVVVMRHELGHLMGLDHARDLDELMFPAITGRTQFGSGDRLGLHLQGSAALHPTAPPPSVGTVVSNFFRSTRIPTVGDGCRYGRPEL